MTDRPIYGCLAILIIGLIITFLGYGGERLGNALRKDPKLWDWVIGIIVIMFIVYNLFVKKKGNK